VGKGALLPPAAHGYSVSPCKWRMLTVIPLCGICRSMVFIESAAFTRRLRELAGDNAGDFLNSALPSGEWSTN